MKEKTSIALVSVFFLGNIQETIANGWFYGHPAPTVSSAVALNDWQDCIITAAMQLDDHISSVMDIASAIEPTCSAKENTAIDAVNKEFLDKNPGLEANMSLTEMDRVRREAHESFRQTIGTLILNSRRGSNKTQ